MKQDEQSFCVTIYGRKKDGSQQITAQKLEFSITDIFSKCDQIRRKLRIWSHLLKKYLMENFVFCVMNCILCGMFDTDAFVLLLQN